MPIPNGPIPHLDAGTIAELLPMPEAIAAITESLASGLDPAADPPRTVVPTRSGQLLLMPSEVGGHTGVKIASVAPANPAVGHPRIQGIYLLMDSETLSPIATLDGQALTALRTPAVSAAAVAALAVAGASVLVVFGTGPQALGHVAAMRSVRPISTVAVVGRDPRRAAAFASGLTGVSAHLATPADVSDADIVVCATTSREPLFDGRTVARSATVVAVGSHEADACELDLALMGRAAVVVEDRATALREAGEVIGAVRAGVLDPESLVSIADLVRTAAGPGHSAPRVFKSVGMAWEDLVVASAAYRAYVGAPS